MAEGEALDESLPAGPQGTSTDMSQPSNLRKAWDSWTSRPENNAAMINFGLQLMQPRGVGETGLSHFATAVGAGAEASQRNVAEQRKQAAEETEQEQKGRALDIKEREAQAYSKYMEGRGVQDPTKMRNQAILKAQAGYGKWAFGASDPLGDTLVDLMKSRYPDRVKTKLDILKNPDIDAAARREYISRTLPSYMVEGGGESPVTAKAPPPGAQIRYNNQGDAVWLDTTSGKWIPAQ